MPGRSPNLWLPALLLLSCPGLVAGGEPGNTAPDDAKLVLPDVTGLAGRDAAAPESTDGEGKRVVRIAVEIDRNGRIRLGDEGTATPWRGTNLPRDEGPNVGAALGGGGDLPEVEEPKEFVIKLAVVDGKLRIEADGKAVADFKALAKALGESKPKPDVAVIDSAADVPFGVVAKVLAVIVEARLPIEFRAPEELAGKSADQALRRQLAKAAASRSDPDGLSALGVLVRADERAPWGSAQEVTVAAMMARTWRLAFAAMVDGREVIIGNVEGKGPKPPKSVGRIERTNPGR